MVNLAGGLEDMAKKPASTIQMLGAEKALFRHFRQGGNPPKHGILFEHEFVSPLHPDVRGKMARFLANKAVIAARLDQYGDKEKGANLREECRGKFEELED
jgi:nucleolar protein 56